MPRNRHRKKAGGAQAPSPSTSAAQDNSRETRSVQEPAGDLSRYSQDALIRIMMDSAELADEPEFADFELNAMQTASVTATWMNKYSRRLEAAEKKGPDAFAEVFDEVRIKSIDELFNPSLRADVSKRLQLLIDRLLFSRNRSKTEQALAVQVVLKEKKIPWGIVGLILSIYTRALERGFEQAEKATEISESLLEAINADELDIEDLLNDREKLEAIAEQISSTRPELLQQADEYLDTMTDTFETELFHGRVALGLFTEEELALPFQRLEAELGKPFHDLERSGVSGEHFMEVITSGISDTLTPKRYQLLRKQLKKIGKAWFREHHRWAGALEAEIGWLDEHEYKESSFIISVFIGQIRRLAEENE